MPMAYYSVEDSPHFVTPRTTNVLHKVLLLTVVSVITFITLWAASPSATLQLSALPVPKVAAKPPQFDPLGLWEESQARMPFNPLGIDSKMEDINVPSAYTDKENIAQVGHIDFTEELPPNPVMVAIFAPFMAVLALIGLARLPRWGMAASSGDVEKNPYRTTLGEDAAVFEIQDQRLSDWVKFVGVFVAVMGGLYVVWINPTTGYADEFVTAMEGLAGGSTEVTMLLILTIFGIAHSGLAGLRPKGEELIGERAYRVLFGLVSLPLALVAIVYFINHRYSGTPLWDLRDVPGVHSFVWILNFISFFFLYPSTFNLLEVAAVAKPKFHMWETGIMRITRHPQMVGQLMWCVAHTLWIGNSFAVVTSAGLMAHHLFGCWHGDRRLSAKYGEAFEEVKARTSTWPFVAILDGRQQLPPDYWKEFARGPYLVITVGTIAAYFAHPLMQLASYNLRW